MPHSYTLEEKSLAKTLAITERSNRRALELLATVWGTGEPGSPELPSIRSLTSWRGDTRVPIDEQLMREWSDTKRARVLATSEKLTDAMAKTVMEARNRYMAGNGTALDVLNITKSFGILADKLNGRFGNQPGVVTSANNVFNGNVQLVAYGPKEEVRELGELT